jgi:hypothetical protein
MIFAFTSIAVLNTLAMIALRRGRELGLLRLVGATHRQVRSMARWEAALIIAIGLGLGLAIAAVALLPLSHALTGSLRPYVPPASSRRSSAARRCWRCWRWRCRRGGRCARGRSRRSGWASSATAVTTAGSERWRASSRRAARLSLSLATLLRPPVMMRVRRAASLPLSVSRSVTRQRPASGGQETRRLTVPVRDARAALGVTLTEGPCVVGAPGVPVPGLAPGLPEDPGSRLGPPSLGAIVNDHAWSCASGLADGSRTPPVSPFMSAE